MAAVVTGFDLRQKEGRLRVPGFLPDGSFDAIVMPAEDPEIQVTRRPGYETATLVFELEDGEVVPSSLI